MASPLAALADVSEVVSQLHGSMIKMENFQKLLELMKDLIGIDNLVTPGRVSSRRDRTPSQMRPYSLYSALLLTWAQFKSSALCREDPHINS